MVWSHPLLAINELSSTPADSPAGFKSEAVAGIKFTSPPPARALPHRADLTAGSSPPRADLPRARTHTAPHAAAAAARGRGSRLSSRGTGARPRGGPPPPRTRPGGSAGRRMVGGGSWGPSWNRRPAEGLRTTPTPPPPHTHVPPGQSPPSPAPAASPHTHQPHPPRSRRHSATPPRPSEPPVTTPVPGQREAPPTAPASTPPANSRIPTPRRGRGSYLRPSPPSGDGRAPTSLYPPCRALRLPIAAAAALGRAGRAGPLPPGRGSAARGAQRPLARPDFGPPPTYTDTRQGKARALLARGGRTARGGAPIGRGGRRRPAPRPSRDALWWGARRPRAAAMAPRRRPVRWLRGRRAAGALVRPRGRAFSVRGWGISAARQKPGLGGSAGRPSRRRRGRRPGGSRCGGWPRSVGGVPQRVAPRVGAPWRGGTPPGGACGGGTPRCSAVAGAQQEPPRVV